MIIESGLIVAVGLLFMFFKMSWKTRLSMLGFPLLMDVAVFVFLNILHWGTFSGVMVAAVGALVCSGLISLGRWSVGYIRQGLYFPGHMNVIHKIK
jgi:hypothetical protein